MRGHRERFTAMTCEALNSNLGGILNRTADPLEISGP